MQDIGGRFSGVAEDMLREWSRKLVDAAARQATAETLWNQDYAPLRLPEGAEDILTLAEARWLRDEGYLWEEDGVIYGSLDFLAALTGYRFVADGSGCGEIWVGDSVEYEWEANRGGPEVLAGSGRVERISGDEDETLDILGPDGVRAAIPARYARVIDG